jgi:hypothetical protein
MQHGDIGVGALLPSDEDSPEAIHPTVRAFHDPAARLVAGGALEPALILTTASDVAGEAKLVDESIDLGAIVALVEAKTLRTVFRWSWTPKRDALESFTRELEVDAVGAADGQAERDARRFGQ